MSGIPPFAIIPPADAIPFDNSASLNTSNPNDQSVQDFINSICCPDVSRKYTFLSNGEIDWIEFFKGAVQTTPNRIARVDTTYDGSLNPTTETWVMYDTADGTTILKTVVFTHTWVSNEITKTTMVTT